MKSIIFIIVVFCACCTACEPGPQNIADLNKKHEQIIDGVETDLNMKILKLKKTGYVLKRDRRNEASDTIKTVYNLVENKINQKVNNDSILVHLIDSIENSYNQIILEPFSDEKYDLKNKWADVKNKFERYDRILKEYDYNPNDSIHVNFWMCTYTINNPKLSNSKQTYERIYSILSDGNDFYSGF